MVRVVLTAALLGRIINRAVAAVAGWQNTTWRMPEDEVKTALGAGVIEIDPPASFSTSYAS
jgi:hypothetical protein